MDTEDTGTYKLVRNELNFNIDGIELSGYYECKFEGEKVYLLPVECTKIVKKGNKQICKSAKTLNEKPIVLDQEKFLNAFYGILYGNLNYKNIEEPVTETIGEHKLSNASGYVIGKKDVIFKNNKSPPSYVAIPIDELVDYSGDNKIINNIIKYIYLKFAAPKYIQEVKKDTIEDTIGEQGGKRKTRRLRKVSKKATKRSKKKSRRKSYRRRARS